MPPSPALKFSPSREARVEGHKRGRSLEGALLLREKDEDLALFNEVQNRERETFLLQSSDDFEDAFSSKLRHFSDYKLGITIPNRGESSDLLNVDGDKTDYDWLLTPPDTPLFPSLDDETEPVNAPVRGRPRSQPISISRSSTMERSYRSSRGSASPSRSSPSPRSVNSTGQSRIKPSSAPHSSPISSLRNATPSRRVSSPSSKPSTPIPRSSSPTPRRLSTGSSVSSGIRGTSPVKVSRGNSASPKIRAWQANIPGFSSDAPPNLRTSLADRPASYVRGSSPASRNGRDFSKFSRQSMSPTASRSVSSSYSHEKDWFSSYSKGSMASSGDDDVDSLQSVTVGSLDQSTFRKPGVFSNNSRPLAFSKKSARVLSSASTSKRTYDLSSRQADNRKAPQNMFRPLLSSVPSTTFYAGKASSAHHSIISRHSSVSNSITTSSDQGAAAIPETEGHGQNLGHVADESLGALYPDVQEGAFAVDEADTADLLNDVYHESPDIQHSYIDENHTTENSSTNHDSGVPDHMAMKVVASDEALDVNCDNSEIDHLKSPLLCSICGSLYDCIDSEEKDIGVCPECRENVKLTHMISQDTTAVIGDNTQMIMPEDSQDLVKSGSPIAVPESVDVEDIHGSDFSMVKENSNEESSFCREESANHTIESCLHRSQEERHEHNSIEQIMGQPAASLISQDRETSSQELERCNSNLNAKVNAAEVAGISLLLKRSTSSKGLHVQGRTYSASVIPYDDISYARNSSNCMRNSIGHGSVSSSSSIDHASSRHSDIRPQRQLSGRKSDIENWRGDLQSQSVGSYQSGTSNHAYQALSHGVSTYEKSFGAATEDVGNDVVELAVASSMHVPGLEKMEADPTSPYSVVTTNGKEESEYNGMSRTLDASMVESSSYVDNLGMENLLSNNAEDTGLRENGEDIQDNRSLTEPSTTLSESTLEKENSTVSTCMINANGAEASGASSLVEISEIEVDSCQNGVPTIELDDVSTKLKSTLNELQEHSEKDLTSSVAEPDHVHIILEDSTVTVEGQDGSKVRSLTLEEATDTILFCSSIVHDLAYKAATIAMEKETLPLEDSRPTVTILGKTTYDRKDPRSGGVVSKRGMKSQKARQKRLETENKPPSIKTENDENVDESLTHNVGLPDKWDSAKPPKLESKCNCTIM